MYSYILIELHSPAIDSHCKREYTVALKGLKYTMDDITLSHWKIQKSVLEYFM